MKVVLLENIKGLGKKGEVKEVKDGYGMNFLVPQKKVVLATNSSIKQSQLKLQKEEENKEKELLLNKEIAKKIEGKELVLKAKAQKEKLFGALTEKDIKEALAEDGIGVGSGKINLNKPVKKVGKFDLEVEWDNDLKAKFKLIVIEES